MILTENRKKRSLNYFVILFLLVQHFSPRHILLHFAFLLFRVDSKREKIVKFLQSNPVQILLCVIVLLDAGIVIAQILLDLNSVKGNAHYTSVTCEVT